MAAPPVKAGSSLTLSQVTRMYRPQFFFRRRQYSTQGARNQYTRGPLRPLLSKPDRSFPPEWLNDPTLRLSDYSGNSDGSYGSNQHMILNEEFNQALRQIVRSFRAPVRYAVAYGSGVFSQSPSSSTPISAATTPQTTHPHPPEAIEKWQKSGGKMVDFLFGVTHTQHWHSLNLNQHRSHYSAIGSLGSGLVSRVQDDWGAGVYFNPYITINGTLIKYGVVNIDTLVGDLSNWSTLYLAGRMQKPVKIIRDDPTMIMAHQINLLSAVRAALLMLPERFTERELYSTIAGISYMGDPRVSIGAEAPDKIRNIVENQLPRFRKLYQPLIHDMPNAQYMDARCREDMAKWHSDIDLNATLKQDMDPVKRGNMVRRLPQAFRNKVYFLYQSKYEMPRAEFDRLMEESNDDDKDRFKKQLGGDFERRIAAESDLREKMGKAIKATVQWPSVGQAAKGVVTAGFAKSWRYFVEKRRKGRKVVS